MRTFILFLIPILLLRVSGFSQSEVMLRTPTGMLFGTLQTPDTKEAVPVVLIIAGSGPTDRDGNNMQMQNNSLKMLADSLLSHGIASLRYDKRGIEMSKEAGLNEQDLRFGHYVSDAEGWATMLRKDARFSEVWIAGHSEGSLIGMIAARNTGVHGFISIAGAGKSAAELLKEQLASLPGDTRDQAFTCIDSLKAGHTVAVFPPSLFMVFRPSVQPYLVSWFQYDPSSEIARLEIPVLILQGTTDIQVAVKDAELLSKANPGASLKVINGMNHILKNAGPMRVENLATYSDPVLPINQELVGSISKFIITR